MELSNLLIISLKLLLVFVASVLLIIYLYITKDYGYWKKRGVPYAKPSWIFGNLGFLMRESYWNFMYQLWRKYPVDYVGVLLGHKPALIVQSADIAKRIFTKDAAFFEDRFIYSGGKSDPIGALNLFTVKNPLWSELRQELSPIFTSSRLRSLAKIMNFNARELVERIEIEHVKKNQKVNLKDLFSRYTSDTVGYTVFGLSTSALKDDSNPLWLVSTHMVKWTFWRGFEFSITFLVPAVAKLMRLKFFSEGATQYIRKMFYSVVNDRKDTNKQTDTDLVNMLLALKDNIKNIPKDAGPDFLDNLMLGQIAIFILGSIETSSSTISYLLHELAYHPEEQNKLFEEIDGALKQTGKENLEFNDLLELKYLSSCIQETLRKYVPVPHTDRVCSQEYKIDDKLTLAKGTPVFVSLVAIHNDERNYPEPRIWRPERFTGVNADSDHRNNTFLPFGDGPRFCIGKRYGMLQVRAAVAQVVHHFRIEPDAPYDIASDPYSLVLSPLGGGAVKFVPRN